MRPLELRLRDFRSYRGKDTVIDFRHRRLLGIVGPIGSGKSTVLDAISFALYGRTPRVARDTKSLIHQQADGATVALRFQVDGQVWEAVRALRRRGQSQHALFRYVEDTPDAEAVEKITQEADVNARVVELLGLEFDAFGRSVMLPQGRFAEFLASRPADRDKVLKGVFGHDRIDRMRELAKARAAEMQTEIDKLGVRVEQLEALAERLAEETLRMAGLEERADLLAKAEPELAILDETIAHAAARLDAGRRRADELETMVDEIPETDTTERLLRAAETAGTEHERRSATLTIAEGRLAEAVARLDAAQAAGEPALLDEAGRLLAAAQPLQDASRRERARLQAARRKLDDAANEVQRAETRRSAAEDELAESEAVVGVTSGAQAAAEQTLHAARHADMAATLRAELVAGDPCPVCERAIDEPPRKASPADLGAAERELERARRDASAAQKARSEAAAELRAAVEAAGAALERRERVAEEAEEAARTAQEAETAWTTTMADLVALLGEGEPAELLAERRAAWTALTTSVTAARDTAEAARREVVEAEERTSESRRSLMDLRVRITELATRLGAPVTVGDEQPGTLRRALGALRDASGDELRRLSEERSSAETRRTEAEACRTAKLGELGVEGDFGKAMADARAHVEALRATMDQRRHELVAGERWVERRDEVAARQELFIRLSNDLTNAKFIRYLLDEERSRLSELGSDHFQRLTSGRYRFTEDGSFDVLDLTAAEAVRSSDSLSGGETFLASLALALALAEMVARVGGRMDAFFLDEGFGTLDPEHLDLAMDGIASLVTQSDSRVVTLVSHVPELRDRLEDLIVLDRDPVTGSTIVRRGARQG